MALSHGFIGHEDLAEMRVNLITGASVYDMVTRSAAMHTESVNKLLAAFCRRTTDFKWKFHLPNTSDLQPADGSTKPDIVKGTTSYDVALPIQGGKIGYGFDMIAAAKATLNEVNAQTLNSLMADGRWLKRHILAALFTNQAWDFVDPERGTLSIKPLASADGNEYPLISGGTENSQHFLAQSAGIADATNPFDNIYAQLKKHPSNMVSAQNPVICYVPTNVVGTVRALANFVEVGDTDILKGANSDTVAASAARLEQIRGFGDEVLGKTDNCWIVEWGMLPDNYIIGHATGAGPVLGMREHAEAELQGFFVKNNNGNPIISETYFYRFAGFGVINRVAAVVQRVGDASYAIPTGYTAPLGA
jgi:hypothetical protein